MAAAKTPAGFGADASRGGGARTLGTEGRAIGPSRSGVRAERDRVRKLYRSSERRLLGGVAGGLAAHFGLPVLWVRAAFVVLAFGQGLGLLLYAAFWFVVPMGVEPSATGRQHGWRRRKRRDGRELGAVIALLAGTALLLNSFGGTRSSGYLWPVLVVCAGAALVWRQADDAQRVRFLALGKAGMTGRGGWQRLRTLGGVLLVTAGIASFLLMRGSVAHLGQVLQAALAMLLGVVLLVGPHLVRRGEDLGAERRERIRAQERAEVAAHVHDSVLHTLTLILRHSENPREVSRLARSQERELREWLYRPHPRTGPEGDPADEPTATPSAEPERLAASVRKAAGEVEDAHGTPVEVVCVGDCPLDPGLTAQLMAAREAMVNAAKYGGDTGPVSVFAEVEGQTVSVFVRDRGPGFDPDEIPEDRLGVRESILGRMRRNGGTAHLRSTPGEGTEIELEMERANP